MMPMATRMIRIRRTLKAAAAPRRPASVCDRICTVIRFQSADTRKMAALMAVMARTKEKTRPEKKAGTSRGNVMRRKVTWVEAPRLVAASSMAGSICRRPAMPDWMPTGM